MTRDPEKYLFDILDSSRFLIEFTANEGPERYRNDRAYRAAVERELQIIGEAMMQLKSVRSDLTDGIAESERIIKFRHVLVHGYHTLDADTICTVLREKLPALRVEVEKLMDQIG